MTNKELMHIAKAASKFAYAPYSNYYVGAALITSTGKIYTGCNVENASFGATNCAERTAIFKAISEGEKEISKIAIFAQGNKKPYPCGICLQVLTEFMKDGEVILEDNDGNITSYSIHDLIPYAFTL